MPQHEMPFDGHDDMREFQKLDSFTQGYVHAIFFTECHSDNPELVDATFSDLAPETLATIIADCAAFQEANTTLLDTACNTPRYDSKRAGTDYWLTRNGHGAGFWDRGLGETGSRLSDMARLDGSRYAYKGDDEKLYIS